MNVVGLAFVSTVILCSFAGCGDDSTAAASGGGGSGEGGKGGSGEGGKGGSDVSAWEDYCDANVAREEACDPDNPPSPSQAECVSARTCFESVFRDAAREPLMDCLSSRPCDKNDDLCYTEVGAAIGTIAEQEEYLSSCNAKLDECPGDLSNDWCTQGDVPWPLFGADLYTELVGCFAESCELVGDCLEQSLHKRTADCDGEIGL